MPSNYMRLNWNDALRGAVPAVLAGVFIALVGTFQSAGFDVFNADWGSILAMAINAGFSAFVGYIGKQLMTDSEGVVHTPFGKINPGR